MANFWEISENVLLENSSRPNVRYHICFQSKNLMDEFSGKWKFLDEFSMICQFGLKKSHRGHSPCKQSCELSAHSSKSSQMQGIPYSGTHVVFKRWYPTVDKHFFRFSMIWMIKITGPVAVKYKTLLTLIIANLIYALITSRAQMRRVCTFIKIFTNARYPIFWYARCI